MKVGLLDAEIEKMGMVKYHRVFVPGQKDHKNITDHTLVETVDIYIKDDVPLGQVLEELEKTCILEHCYAAITNNDDKMIYLSDKGKERIIRFESENFSSLEELVEKKDKPIHWTAIKEINLSFNVGSFIMIFG